MAAPITLKGSKFLILLGDGAGPEVFAAPCALSTKGISFTGATNDYTVPDCAMPDDPGWVNRVISTLTAGVTGSGILAMADHEKWRDWFFSADAKNIKVKLDIATGSGGGSYTLSAILTELSITGNNGEFVNIDVTMASNGPVTFAAT